MIKKRSNWILPTILFAVFLMLCSGATAIFAQVSTGTILGVVKDSSGAVVPGTTLTARNVQTGLTRRETSAADGSYRFSAMPVGLYELRAEHSGFESQLSTGLTLTVTQELVINVTLQVGSVGETVSVTAQEPLVNTTSGSLGGLVDQQRISDLPLNGRDLMSLTFLNAGATEQLTTERNKGEVGDYFSTNGATFRSNNYLIDGASMLNIYGATPADYTGQTLGVDGIQEYQVVTTGFGAQYGQTMGSQTLLVSKGGTNSFHGTAFEFLRNSVLDARNYFDYPSVESDRRLPNYVRNNFGGSFGGPIRKNNTFFFATYEGLRLRTGDTIINATIPAADRVNGGLVPTISPNVQGFLALFPLPNLPNNQYGFVYDVPTSEDYGQLRIDHTLSTADTMFYRFTIEDSDQGRDVSYPQFLEFGHTGAQYHTLSENHIFSPNLLNTLRFSFSRSVMTINFLTNSSVNNPQVDLVAGLVPGTVSIGGLTGLAAGDGPIDQKQNIFQESDDLIYTYGKHSFKFGALINQFQQYLSNDTNVKGTLTFTSLTTFLLGQPNSYTAIYQPFNMTRTFHYSTYGVYAQDDWRASPRLTLNLGLRYEFATNPTELHNTWSALVNMATDASMTLEQHEFASNPSLKDFSPRLGFAWDVMGDQKTTFRGSFGLLYDIANYGSIELQSMTSQPPFTRVASVTGGAPSFTLPLSFTPAEIANTLRLQAWHMEQPHMLEGSLAMEHQFPFAIGLTVAYVYTRGIDLIGDHEGNPTIPSSYVNGAPFWTGNEQRVNPNWGTFSDFYSADTNSWYDGLQVTLNKHLSHGLQFQGAYTRSKAIDQNQGQINVEVSGSSNMEDVDGLDIKDDEGLSADDVRNLLKLNAIYKIPNLTSERIAGKLLNGWSTTGILSLQGGYPFTPDLTSNRSRSKMSGGPSGLDRPNIIPGRKPSSITKGVSTGCGSASLGTGAVAAGTRVETPKLWFDPCAFAIQTAGFLGTAGRDILSGPGYQDLDYSMFKDTPLPKLGEAGILEFRAEVFNIVNHANFALPNRSVYAAVQNVENPLTTVGNITSTIGTSREIQFGLKIIF